jgi:hypothetical protein
LKLARVQVSGVTVLKNDYLKGLKQASMIGNMGIK